MNAPGFAAQWLLLDLPGAPEAGVALARSFAGVPRHGLFLETELAPLNEHGPLLLALATDSPLAARCQSEPLAWPGLLLHSAAPLHTLLVHLRRMLTVTFAVHYKGLLNYYNPQIASYFFDACDARELSRWLGPIDQLSWYGGTWADKAVGSLGWQQLVNPRLGVDALAIEDSLSAGQQARLQECLLARHAYQWSLSSGSDFEVIWSHVQEGLGLGFSGQALLDGWLELRLQYPTAPLVEAMPGGTAQERLDYLRGNWQDGPR